MAETLIFPEIDQDFESYLLLLELAKQLLIAQGYEGIYQLASLHPQYRFADVDAEDPANYTNRSPYPMLHLIRESSVEKAIAIYNKAEEIPQRNINLARQFGNASMQNQLEACIKVENKSNHGK